MGRACFVEPQQARGGQRAAECACKPCWVKTGLVETALRNRTYSCGYLHRAKIRGKQIGAARVLAFAEAKHARQGARGRMDHAACVGIVEIETVDQEAVQEHRVTHRETFRVCEHGCVAATEFLHGGQRDARIIERGSRERKADAIQDQMLCAFAYRLRYIRQLQVRRETRKRGGDGSWVHRAIPSCLKSRLVSSASSSCDASSSEYWFASTPSETIATINRISTPDTMPSTPNNPNWAYSRTAT